MEATRYRNPYIAAAAVIAALMALCALILPARAYADVEAVDNPNAAVKKFDIVTKSIPEPSITNLSNCTLENVNGKDENKLNDSIAVAGKWLSMNKGCTTASATLTFSKAGRGKGGDEYDYVVSLKWTIGLGTADKDRAARILKVTDDGCHVTFGNVNKKGNAYTTIQGMRVDGTLHVYAAGTTNAPAASDIRMLWRDIDQPDHSKEKDGYNSDYAERVQLLSGYNTNKQYIGKSVGDGHAQLNAYSEGGDTMSFRATHVCAGSNACSKVAYRASDGHTFALYGASCETGLGFYIDEPKMTVKYNYNAGAPLNATPAELLDYNNKCLRVAENYSSTVPWHNLHFDLINVIGDENKRTGYTVGDPARGAGSGVDKSTYYNLGPGGKKTFFHADDGQENTVNPVNVVNLNGGEDIYTDTEVTIYVMWTPITYSIAYHPNGGGDGPMSNTDCVYDKNANISYNEFRRTGYHFTGWNTKPDGTGVSYAQGQSVVNLLSTQDAVVHLYAQWQPNSYNVYYNANGGNYSHAYNAWDHDVVYYDQEFYVGEPDAREDWRFDGWNLTGMDDKAHYINGAVNTNYSLFPARAGTYKNLTAVDGGSVYFTAQWTPLTTLIYHVDDTTAVWKTEVLEANKLYKIPDAYLTAAWKTNCHRESNPKGYLDKRGIDGWYKKSDYDRSSLYAESGEILPQGKFHVYARNWSTLWYKHGAMSDPNVTYTGVDNGVTGDIAKASGSKAYKEIPYGESTNLDEVTSRRVTYDAGWGFPSTLRAVLGWYAREDLTGTTVTRWTSSGDATVYKKWDASITDGVVVAR